MGIKVEGMSWNTAHVASMSEKEFVDLHMKDSGVYPLLSEADKIKALKLAHNTVVPPKKSAPSKPKSEESPAE